MLLKWPLLAQDTELQVCRDITIQPSKQQRSQLESRAEQLADFFDACRRKRNEIDYTGAMIATTTEADELLLHAKSFLDLVEKWIEVKYPKLKR